MSDEAATLADDAQLLERAVRESWPRSHPELRELLARRPDWAELLEASASADTGEERIERIAQAVTEQDRRLVDESLALVRRPAVQGARAGGGRAPYLRWVLAAAAVLAVAGTVALWRRDATAPGAESPILLGPDESVSDEEQRITLVSPLERVERIESFEWTSKRDLQPGQRYLLILSAVREDGTRGEELLRRFVDRAKWLPDAYDLVDLPLRLHWSVQRVSANGLQDGQAAEALVERSSP